MLASATHSSASAIHAFRGEQIAHVIETAGPGGAERMLAELARAQQQLGATVTAFLPESHEGWLPGQLEEFGIGVERFTLGAPFSWQCVQTLVAKFRERSITLVHSHDFTMAVNGAWASRRLGLPHVITMHGGRYYAGKLRRRLLLRAAMASSGAVVAVSDALADTLSAELHIPRTRIHTIPNGVRVARTRPANLRAELGLDSNARIVLSLGNLYPVKGHAVLVNALPYLPAQAHLVIAGRGGEEATLRQCAAALGLSARLHLLGHRDDVAGLLQAADIFVQPSLDEGLPLAVLEAMFAAKPIVATDVGDVAQALGAEGGVVVPAGDAQALGEAVSALLDQPERARAFATAAQARAEHEYGMTTAVRRYAKVYEPLLAPRAIVERSASVTTALHRSIRAKTSANTGND